MRGRCVRGVGRRGFICIVRGLRGRVCGGGGGRGEREEGGRGSGGKGSGGFLDGNGLD